MKFGSTMSDCFRRARMKQELTKSQPCAVRIEGFVAIQYKAEIEGRDDGKTMNEYKFFMVDDYDEARDMPEYNGTMDVCDDVELDFDDY